jgi:hypothetical protein
MTLQAYERAWRSLLVDELALRLSIRMLYGWIGDRRMDSILRYILRNGPKDLIRRKDNIDWHRDLISKSAPAPAPGRAWRQHAVQLLRRVSTQQHPGAS